MTNESEIKKDLGLVLEDFIKEHYNNDKIRLRHKLCDKADDHGGMDYSCNTGLSTCKDPTKYDHGNEHLIWQIYKKGIFKTILADITDGAEEASSKHLDHDGESIKNKIIMTVYDKNLETPLLDYLKNNVNTVGKYTSVLLYRQKE